MWKLIFFSCSAYFFRYARSNDTRHCFFSRRLQHTHHPLIVKTHGSFSLSTLVLPICFFGFSFGFFSRMIPEKQKNLSGLWSWSISFRTTFSSVGFIRDFLSGLPGVSFYILLSLSNSTTHPSLRRVGHSTIPIVSINIHLPFTYFHRLPPPSLSCICFCLSPLYDHSHDPRSLLTFQSFLLRLSGNLTIILFFYFIYLSQMTFSLLFL